MAVIIIAGHLRVAPGERDHYLAVVSDVALQARAAPGCLDFVQSADPIEVDRINVYERWDSDESLLSFRTTNSSVDTNQGSTPEILGADVAKYRISTVEAP